MVLFGLGRLWQQHVKKDRERRDFRVVSVCGGRQGEGKIAVLGTIVRDMSDFLSCVMP